MILTKAIPNPVSYIPNTTGGMTTSAGMTVGGDFTVDRATKLVSIGWNDPIPGISKPVGLWNATSNTLIASRFLVSGSVASFNLMLAPNVTYRIGAVVGPSSEQFRNTVTPANVPTPLTLGTGRFVNGATLANPTGAAAGWYGGFIFNASYDFLDTRTEPPEPVIATAAGIFHISLPKEWLPTEIKEWDLQYQRSFDGATYGSWIDLGTFPARTIDDGLEDVGEDPSVYASHTHTTLDTSEPRPFYNYRYRIRTVLEESDWSEISYAGQVKKGTELITGAEIDQDTLDPPDTSVYDGGTFTGVNLVDATLNHSLTGVTTLVGNMNGGTLQPSSLQITTGGNNITGLTTTNLATSTLGVTNTLTVGSNVINQTAITSALVTSTLYNGTTISVSGTINGNTLGTGTFNGVTILNGVIDGTFIKANSVTADKIKAGSIDSNVMQNSFLDANFITGGRLALGGLRNFSSFISASGELVYPWKVEGNAEQYTSYVGKLVPPTTTKFTTLWGSTARVNMAVGATFAIADELRISHVAHTLNAVKTVSFTINSAMPASGPAFSIQAVDQNGVVRWTKAGNGSETSTVTLSVQAQGAASTLSFRIYCTTAGTVPAGTYFMEISNVTVTYVNGNGIITVHDAAGTMRAIVSSEQIAFRRSATNANEEIFRVTDSGTWMAQDSLTIGSNQPGVGALTYSPRDLSGTLAINPRFENLRTADPTHVVPSDWTYLSGTSTTFSMNEDYIGYIDGIYPQWQSLVSGRVLTMELQSGWSGTGGQVIRAVSHKRYVQPDSSMPSTVPISFSAFFRTPLSDPQVEVRMYLYSSTSRNDISTQADTVSDTLLGTATKFGTDVSSTTADSQVEFKQISRSFIEADNTGSDTMSVGAGAFIYIVLEARVKAGQTLSTNKLVEWDNVDLVLSEKLTPSDTQAEADLARRITDLQLLFQYLLSGTMAVLPEITATENVAAGFQGLQMEPVS